MGAVLRQAEIAAMVGAVEAIRLLETALPRGGPLAATVLAYLEGMRDDVAARLRRQHDGRRAAEVADLVITCLEGAIRDGLLLHPAGFAAIDDLDFREWLASHGARSETADSPIVRAMYDLVFAYEDGDPRRPRFAAGLGLFLAGKLFFEYRGAIFWGMEAGSGDVVFAPLYEALRARGVRFAFFHRVDQLHVSDDGGSIQAVSVARQARLADGRAEYDPLVRVKGLPCFPSRPLDEQLVAPTTLDLESAWGDRSSEEAMVLRAGEDFDDLVLATSLGIVPRVCGELIARSPRWRAMVDHVATVPTQSLQIWLRRRESELGWHHPRATVSGYLAPFDTYASMSHLIPREDWADGRGPQAIAYFCSALPAGAATDPEAARRVVRANAVDQLTHFVGHIWPHATTPDGGLPMGAALRRGRRRGRRAAGQPVLERQRRPVGPVRAIAAGDRRPPAARGRIRLRQSLSGGRLDQLRPQRGMHRGGGHGRDRGGECGVPAPADRGHQRNVVRPRGFMTGSDGHRGDLSALQRSGVATATEVFERLIEELDGVERAASEGRRGVQGLRRWSGPQTFQRSAQRSLAPSTSTPISSAEHSSSTPTSSRALRGQPGRQHLSPTGRARRWPSPRRLAPKPSRRCGCTTRRRRAVEDIALRMTDLTAHDGARIPASAAAFVPARMDVGAAASRSSSLSVDVPHSAPDGTYVGHVLATGLPGTSLTVSLVVAS